jgi:phenylalanyl-tRNA synthetase alpha chain
MLIHNIGDLRSLFESDTRLLGQFKWLLQEVG